MTVAQTSRLLAVFGIAASLMAGCGSDSGAVTTDTVTVDNCGEQVTFPHPVERLFVNDGGMIAITLAAGARDSMVAVSSMARDVDVLRLEYGSQVDDLNEVAPSRPTLENIVGAQPQVLFAGYNYGMGEERGITPEILDRYGIAVYQLSEACRQMPGQAARGTMDPWVALDTDLRNIGIITGNAEQGARAADDIAERLEKLRAAPQPERKPTVFLFDSGTDTIFSSGMFGGPQGIIDAAGARNATEDVRDTWTTVSWERIATADPDLIVFVDYPGQTVEEKIAALRANPASRNLRAVRENRFINLPYAMWVSSPLNIDAAEILRSVLEKHGLAPESGITPSLDVTQLGLAGNDWLE
ncbi:ABC transporter substrate-binding protein [Mycolicibacterium thermoresistibile]|jgi:iron complex transport system substrate-binding protein|uniref:ABC transporter substrate-binding protein n=1 Tax=Mycolicibacterium thermoresistibile TaxID=1797 RepID=UPI0018D55EC9|nr:ABC transporter substrate-binding protein [Mycolicibacterium thermoresistibile]MCV7188176.1 ABC transporter substrate-binding protein [Mycolicibacterium thermoresistibile]